MWADLTGSAGSRPLWEGARDHMTSCVASFLFSSSPAASAPALSPSKISLVANYFVFIIHGNSIFFSVPAFPWCKHAVFVQNGPDGTSLIGAWAPPNVWEKYKNCRIPSIYLLLHVHRFFGSSGRHLEGGLLQGTENK
jgi:hypothetical protein